jgi:(p)ppGpp synthase/HD superfamily hydrolase
MMEMSLKCKEALAFATQKHDGQTRRGGLAYITHPIAVAEILESRGFDERYILAGLFHDLLEDTDARDDEILALSSEEVLAAVKLLTKTEGYVMSEYMAGIVANPIAREVKAADRLHNLSCAHECSEAFRVRYIKESIDWYLDLSPDISKVTRKLIDTLSDKSQISDEYMTRLEKYL